MKEAINYMIFILLITYFLSESTKSIWLALQNVLILSLSLSLSLSFQFQIWIYLIPQ